MVLEWLYDDIRPLSMSRSFGHVHVHNRSLMDSLSFFLSFFVCDDTPKKFVTMHPIIMKYLRKVVCFNDLENAVTLSAFMITFSCLCQGHNYINIAFQRFIFARMTCERNSSRYFRVSEWVSCLTTPGLSKDIRRHTWLLYSHQVSKVNYLYIIYKLYILYIHHTFHTYIIHFIHIIHTLHILYIIITIISIINSIL